MYTRSEKKGLGRALAIATMVLSVCVWAHSETHYKVLHSFGSASDGGGPAGSVTLDKKGRVYGATSGGGAYNGGIAFRLTPQPNGEWTEKILHSFYDSLDDAAGPNGGLVQGKGGRWYGTSQYGGMGRLNYGTIFELIHTPSGWDENVLYSFGTQSEDGGEPVSGLAMDSAGNLYGTAAYGGKDNAGAVFQLTPNGTGWEETVLYSFCPKTDCPDGHTPFAGLVLDAAGNLYGTTITGGAHKVTGTVYRLSPTPTGWQASVLHNFNNDGKDGYTPGSGALAMDGSGNLYGTTEVGGLYGWGIVYRLKRKADGTWKEKILHHFKEGKGGAFPGSGVVIDEGGNLYGTAVFGGSPCDCGVIYKLASGPDDTWSYSVLHRFKGSDGAMPAGNLVFDGNGNLYGRTGLGGDYGPGVVFELTP